MAARWFEEDRLNEHIPPQVEQVDEVTKDGQEDQVDQVLPQGDHVPSEEGGTEVPMVPPELINQEIGEALISIDLAITNRANFSMVPSVEYCYLLSIDNHLSM